MREATALRGARRCIYVLLKIEQACTNSRDLVYVSKNRTGVFYFKRAPIWPSRTYVTSIYHISSQTAGLAGGSYTLINTILV